jgi:regulatory protein
LLHLLPVFSKSPQLVTEAELYAAATRILTRRAHSVHEMKLALAHRTDDEQLIKAVLERLKREGLIDDARYAKQFARQRTEVRRQGRFRIARDLRARGVPNQHIEAALQENAQEHDEVALVRQTIQRKLRSFRGALDEKKLASLYRSLLRAGFSADVVRREVKSITSQELPSADAESAG